MQTSGNRQATTSLHHDRRTLSTLIRADSLLTRLHTPLGRITHAATQTKTPSILSTPRPGPMNLATFQQGATTSEESRPDPPVPQRNRHAPDHCFSFARSPIKRKGFLALTNRNQHECSHQHYHRTHTQDLRLFHGEISKVTWLPLILFALRLRYNPSVTQ